MNGTEKIGCCGACCETCRESQKRCKGCNPGYLAGSRAAAQKYCGTRDPRKARLLTGP